MTRYFQFLKRIRPLTAFFESVYLFNGFPSRSLLLFFLGVVSSPISFSLIAAETAIDKNTIIQSLKPQETVKTRSLRNLSVEKAEPPSISLVIEFDFNSSKISPDSLQQISVLAEAMSSNDLLDYSFKVEGHTDAKGRYEYNQKLSERRAEAVKQALLKKGVNDKRLIAIGKGSTEPANAKDPFAPENRRVKVITLND